MAKYHQRKRHAGTLTFFLLVPIADVLGAFLTYLYGSTVVVWLLFFLRFCGTSILTFFYHDMLTTLAIGALLAAAIVACIVRVLEGGKLLALKWFAYPAIFIVAFWIILRVLFQLQITASFAPHLPVFPALDFKDVFKHPTSLAGLVWLIPYGIMHIILRESPNVLPQKRRQERQKKTPPSGQVAHVVDSNLVGEDWEEETVILNPIWADEEKWHILQACIVKYEVALKRLYPLPVNHLRVPRRFCHVAKGTQVVWQGRTLMIPQALLEPMNGHRLLPALARALFAYNRMDLWLRPCMSFYVRQGCFVFILAPLGWFLWLPVLVKYALGWNDWRADRVLDADTFAWMLGQGETLLHQLELMRALGIEEPDPSMPTVEERIGHLQGLLNREHESMQRQGIPQAGPLIGPEEDTQERLKAVKQ